jgi:hypothetical protein
MDDVVGFAKQRGIPIVNTDGIKQWIHRHRGQVPVVGPASTKSALTATGKRPLSSDATLRLTVDDTSGLFAPMVLVRGCGHHGAEIQPSSWLSSSPLTLSTSALSVPTGDAWLTLAELGFTLADLRLFLAFLLGRSS